MPANHRVRLDDHQGVSPARPEPEECNPERAIERREPRSRRLQSVCCELLAQCQFNDRLLVPASKEGKSATKKCRQEIEQSPHRARLCAISKLSTSLILCSRLTYHERLGGEIEKGKSPAISGRADIDNGQRSFAASGCSPTSDSPPPRPYLSLRGSTERPSSPSRKTERSASGMT